MQDMVPYAFKLRFRRRQEDNQIATIASYKFQERWDEQRLHRLCSNANRFVAVAELEIGSKSSSPYVVGFVVFYKRVSRTEIEYLAVHPEWTRLGIGSKLLEFVSAYLPTERYQAYCKKGDEPMRQFLSKNSFDLFDVKEVKGYGECQVFEKYVENME